MPLARRTARSCSLVALWVFSSGCAAVKTLPWTERPPWTAQFPNEKFVEVEGAAIRYQTVGRGPPLLMLHGLGDSMEAFRPLLPHLAPHFTVHLFDARGAGKSERPWPGDYSVEAMAQSLQRFMEVLELRNVPVVAHGWGGTVALRLAATAPGYLQKLVLIAGVAYPEPVRFDPGWAVTKKMIPRMWARDWFVERMYSPEHRPEPARFDAFWAGLQREHGTEVYAAASKSLLEKATFDRLTPLYGQLRVPALILWGEKDALFPPEQGARLCAELRCAGFKSYAGAGHALMEERPHSVSADIHAFLTTAAKADRPAQTVQPADAPRRIDAKPQRRTVKTAKRRGR